MDKKNITACIVLYRNDFIMLKNAIQSILKTDDIGKVYLIDNSPTNELNKLVTDFFSINYWYL